MKLRSRLIIFALYFISLYLIFVFLNNYFIPTGSGKDLWFTSIIGMILYRLLSIPFFPKPSDTLATSITALIALTAYDVSSDTSLTITLAVYFGILFFTALIFVSILAYTLKDIDESRIPFLNYLGLFFYRISTFLGKSEVIFSIPILVSIIGYTHSPRDFSVISLLWISISVIKPYEAIYAIIFDFPEESKKAIERKQAEIGKIIRIDSPNLLRVSLEPNKSWSVKSVKLAKLADNSLIYVLPLFRQIQDDKIIGTGLSHRIENDNFRNLPLSNGVVYSLDSVPNRVDLLKEITKLEVESNLVGFIVEDSEIDMIRLEVIDPTGLREGSVVFCHHQDKNIYYQVIRARTQEESFKENPHGTTIIYAIQLGIPNSVTGFEWYPWVPPMNTPVFYIHGSMVSEEIDSSLPGFNIGTIPETSIKIRAIFNDLASHHTAILGSTGMGKTELVFDIIRQGLRENSKIFCIDITGDYRKRLSDINTFSVELDPSIMENLSNKIDDVEMGNFSASEEKKKLKQLTQNLRQNISSKINEFLTSSPENLTILELTEISNTRATLHLCEIYISELFKWAKQNRPEFQILLVLEEAHNIIPEMNIFGFDKSDTNAVVSKMGQVALQGRKYNIGLLVVSQRTALISKSILSQCNSYFCFHLVDKTSLDYLDQVFGVRYKNVLNNLQKLQCVAHGKGLLTDRPTIIEIPYDPAKEEASRIRLATDA